MGNKKHKQNMIVQADFDAATNVFQKSRNLPGAIFAASNAALIHAQLGDDAKALKVQCPPLVHVSVR